MAIDRHCARVLAIQALCQLDAQGEDCLSRIPGFMADSQAAQATITYAQRLADEAWKARSLTAVEIERQTAGWAADRLTPVDRNVIRVALTEFDLREVPPKVVINEAIEIANAFGNAESRRFINGVLDAIWKTQCNEVDL